jgi:hypothetical protein
MSPVNGKAASGRAAGVALALTAGFVATTSLGCSDDCCTFDEEPIALLRSGGDERGAGALLARGAADGQPLGFVFDTGSPVTFFAGTPSSPSLVHRSFSLIDGRAPAGALTPVRAILNDVGTLDVPLGMLADGSRPDAVFGADILRGYAVELSFSTSAGPAVTFWRRQGASDDALVAGGYAVLHAPLYGAIEISAQGDADFVGMRGPLDVAASRVVLRTCANPVPFSPTGPAPQACCASTLPNPKTGADLLLVVATGIGPVVLSETAWARVEAAAARDALTGVAAGALSAPTEGPPLNVATFPDPIPARWTTLPRMALVDLQASSSSDPGPCVELARARRMEWSETQRVQGTAACVASCDVDPNDRNRSATSAAYLEVGHSVPVAVIPDTAALLQGVRGEIRPQGPEVDGFLGAASLADAHLELDYPTSPARAIFKCEGADRNTCFVAPRCGGVRADNPWRSCFGLPAPSELIPPPACFAPRC